jgi:selenocysteine lyase/cysteine desulfurase
MGSKFNVTEVRKRFPALSGKQVYLDNAGGSQVLQEVVDRCVDLDVTMVYNPPGQTSRPPITIRWTLTA